MLHVFALSFEGSVDLLWSLSLALEIAFNKHDLVTWYKITQAAGIQVAQWDFQNKAARTSPPWPAIFYSLDFAPCDQIVQRPIVSNEEINSQCKPFCIINLALL